MIKMPFIPRYKNSKAYKAFFYFLLFVIYAGFFTVQLLSKYENFNYEKSSFYFTPKKTISTNSVLLKTENNSFRKNVRLNKRFEPEKGYYPIMVSSATPSYYFALKLFTYPVQDFIPSPVLFTHFFRGPPNFA